MERLLTNYICFILGSILWEKIKMINIIEKENIEWERARKGSKISKEEELQMENAICFFEDEKEFQQKELKSLRKIANFE